MRTSATTSSLTAVQVLLAVMLASTSLLAVAWIGGSNGIGILPSPLPGTLMFGNSETDAMPYEAVVIRGEPGVATVAAGDAITGGSTERLPSTTRPATRTGGTAPGLVDTRG